MEHQEVDLNKLAAEIPDNWCKDEELDEISMGIFDDLKESMNTSAEEVAKLVNCAPEDVVETLEGASQIYGRMALFEDKFEDIVSAFPLGPDGEKNYPDKILAKIFGVSIEKAIKIFEDNFGLHDIDTHTNTIIDD